MTNISPYVWVGMKYRPSKKIDHTDIINAVCDEYKINREVLNIRKRLRLISEPRQVAMCLLRRYNWKGMTFKEIGSLFGRYDHTTVLYSCQTVENLFDTDPRYKEIVNNIKKSLWLPITLNI